LLLRSQTAPEIVSTTAAARVHELEAGLWQVDIDIPMLPPSPSLGQGWKLRIPGQYRELPVDIRHGWEQDHPAYSGGGFYRNNFALTAEEVSFGWLLRFPHVSTALVGYINQDLAGSRGWPPYELELPHDSLKIPYNHIELAVWNTAGNAFYRDTPYKGEKPQSSGLAGVPGLIPFVRLQVCCKRK
jgi:hypothetical protein